MMLCNIASVLRNLPGNWFTCSVDSLLKRLSVDSLVYPSKIQEPFGCLPTSRIVLQVNCTYYIRQGSGFALNFQFVGGN